MKVAKNLVFKIEIEIEIIEIHAILKLKLKYSKQSKFKSNWPHISVIEIAIEIETHFKIEITLHQRRNSRLGNTLSNFWTQGSFDLQTVLGLPMFYWSQRKIQMRND